MFATLAVPGIHGAHANAAWALPAELGALRGTGNRRIDAA